MTIQQMTMTGLRCPNCGFYNLSARAKCARCGKSLPELTPDQRNIFPEDEASGSGSGSAITGEVITQTTRVSPEVPGGEPAAPAAELEPEAVSTSETGATLEPEPGAEAQDLPEPEILPEPEPAREEPLVSQDATVPTEYVPEVPSFDRSSSRKLEADRESGNLSSFFKDVKRKPEPAREEPEGEASEVKVGVEESEESLSHIGLEKEEPGTPSFKPDFNKPLFPEFGEGSGEKGDLESSESAVSAPTHAGKGRIFFGGVIDLLIYLVIAAVLVLAGQWASGIFAGDFSRLELLRFFGLPILLSSLIVVWFYQVFFISVLGQTPGGMVSGIEILELTGKRPRILKAGLRALIYVLCLIPFGLGFLPALLSNSFPDRIAHTKHVRW